MISQIGFSPVDKCIQGIPLMVMETYKPVCSVKFRDGHVRDAQEQLMIEVMRQHKAHVFPHLRNGDKVLDAVTRKQVETAHSNARMLLCNSLKRAREVIDLSNDSDTEEEDVQPYLQSFYCADCDTTMHVNPHEYAFMSAEQDGTRRICHECFEFRVAVHIYDIDDVEQDPDYHE